MNSKNSMNYLLSVTDLFVVVVVVEVEFADIVVFVFDVVFVIVFVFDAVFVFAVVEVLGGVIPSG